MRGMPTPVTFGFPGCERGSIVENYVGFVRNFHPSLSIWLVHPLCPFSGKERLVVFLCSVAFNFLWTAFTTFHKERVEDSIERTLGGGVVLYALVKHTVTVIYAVLIRQIVICPCLYEPVIHAACDDHRTMTTDELRHRASKLQRWKERGDRLLLALSAVHISLIVAVIYIVTTEDWLAGYRSPQKTVVSRILVSEAVNFFIWFLKFAPLFLILYPIHRAQWFQGGDLKDYVLCRRSFFVSHTPNFRDKDFPRCVRPETQHQAAARLSAGLQKHQGFVTMSTIRRGDSALLDIDSDEMARVRCTTVSRSLEGVDEGEAEDDDAAERV